MKRVRVCCWLLILSVALTGCNNGPGVRKVKTPSMFAAWKASAVGKNSLSQRTTQTIRQLDLETTYNKNPIEAFAALHTLAVRTPCNKDLLFALAEVSYTVGRKMESQKNSEAIAYYYLCAGYSYHYLFGDQTGNCKEPLKNLIPAEEAFDPRFRLACELYNNGLAKCIQAAQNVGRLDPRQQLHLPTADGGVFTLSVTHHGFAWQPEEFGKLMFCKDYEVIGLANHFRTYGLGVPLIGTRVESVNATPSHAFYPKEVSFPVTAFFRFGGSVAELGERRAGRLELYNPLEVRKIKVQDRAVPLETDLTTPLAYFLTKTDLNGVEIPGFFRADTLQDRTGIYMFEPYQPGKIPVVMVHGLLSSPLTWTSMFNELRADPVLNQRYQFWFYLYPTGSPYLATAADLRTRLKKIRTELDPCQEDGALEDMVLVGHSMGGLIGKLQTQESGNDFWQLASEQPFTSLKASEDVKEQLQQIFFFEREPSIKRVIFLATPHRGSKYSPSLPNWLVTKLIRLPKNLMQTAEELMEDNSGVWTTSMNDKKFQRIPTSLDMLKPGTPALQLLSAKPAPADVRYHSIIGTYQGQGKDSHDGVVTYSSSHIEGVESELLVPSHHISIHHHPLALLEVRRILHKHARENEALNQIVPAFRKVETGGKEAAGKTKQSGIKALKK